MVRCVTYYIVHIACADDTIFDKIFVIMRLILTHTHAQSTHTRTHTHIYIHTRTRVRAFNMELQLTTLSSLSFLRNQVQSTTMETRLGPYKLEQLPFLLRW